MNQKIKKNNLLFKIRENWKFLHDEDFPVLDDIALYSHENFSLSHGIKVKSINPGPLLKKIKKVDILYCFFFSLKVLYNVEKKSVVIINGGYTYVWLFCGLLNYLPFIGSKKLLCFDLFVEYKGKKNEQFKKKLASFVIKKYIVSVVWSKKQIKSHAQYFNLSEDNFIYFPYKSNHSQGVTYDLPLNNFIFAGGNSNRDYKTLIDAVRGTNIPVVISVTDQRVRKQIEYLPNVVVLGAPEPAFAQLQAASRFVVVPIAYTGLRGSGEANFCNAMWHKKPIIAVDSMSACDYVLDGYTGYVVEPGDDSRLKEVIHFLWNSPEVCDRYGKSGRKHVEANFTHELFIQRLLRLAQAVGNEKL